MIHQAFKETFKCRTECEMRFDPISRKVFSSDASMFQVEPLGIAFPKTEEELAQVVQIAYELKIPVIPRGGATGITGGCLGKGLVIDTSKYLHQILEVNYDDEYVRVQPGVVLDDLNQLLAEKGWVFGPSTSTSNRATLGGMAGNNAAGARSLLYGKMVNHTLGVRLIGFQGQKLEFGEQHSEETKEDSFEDSLYTTCKHIVEEYRQDIVNHFPEIDRRVSGYNLDELLKSPLNLAKLIVGSEGSLGIISELKLRICRKPAYLGLLVIHFHDLIDATKNLNQMLHWSPFALEMIDEKIIHLARTRAHLHAHMNWIRGEPEAIVIAEFQGSSEQDVRLKLSTFEADMRHHGIGYAHVQIVDPDEMKHVWDVRKRGLVILMSKRSYTNAVAFLEDMTIPPASLSRFMEYFLSYLAKEGKEAGFYGHVGSGCMHIRPYFNLKDPKDLELIDRMMEDLSSFVLEVGGALSGEHGDGLIRSGYNEKMFGPRVYAAFLEIKNAFDPENLFNPGKVVRGKLFRDQLDSIKVGPETKDLPVSTFLDFSREGGFHLAVDMCNGNGLCRKKEGVMCPSYQATLDEHSSTRGRAQALKAWIHEGLGKSPPEGVLDVLDLCLQCKGCKTECPAQVDMAKMKAEFLYQYQKVHGVPFRSRLISNMSRFFRLSSPLSSLVNRLIDKKWFRALQSKWGIAPERSLPHLAPERFSKWFQREIKPKQMKGQRVVLLSDTYTEFSCPEIGKSAVQILNALGYEVIVPPWGCCGRPQISKGLLQDARHMAKKLLQTLAPYAKAHIPIIGLEPSCILTLIDEYRDFGLPTEALPLCQTFDSFLFDHLDNGALPVSFKYIPRPVKVHGHCHQKALIGMEPTLAVLKAVPGYEVSLIQSGCCGMAGSFGYEKEHYDLSLKIGELKLLPKYALPPPKPSSSRTASLAVRRSPMARVDPPSTSRKRLL